MTPPPLDLRDLARQHQRLCRLALALVGDEHGAEDVAQDAWVRALQRGPREASSLGAWLSTVTQRIASNARRSRTRSGEREREVAQREALPSSAEIAARVELEGRVLASLDGLDEPHRTALRDRYLGDLTPQQIAARDGLPLNTVKARLARARVALRARLERDGLGEDVHWSLALAPLLVPPHALPLAPLTGPPPMLAAAASVASATLGSALIMKKLALVAGVVLVSVLAWQVARPPATQRVSNDGGSAPSNRGNAELVGVPEPADLAAASLAPLAAPASGGRVASTAGATSAAAWRIRGRARAARTKGSAQGVELTLALFDGYRAGGEPWHTATVVTNAEGEFEVALDDPGRTVTLTIAATPSDERKIITYGPYVAIRGEGELPPLDVLVFEIDARLEGVVRDAHGAPVRGALVEGMYGSTESGGDGAYAMAIAAHSWGGVRVSAAGLGEVEHRLEGLEPGSTTVLDFELSPAASIVGVVRDEHGAPLEGVLVSTSSASRQKARTDLTGRYKLDRLPLSANDGVQLSATAEGFVAAATVLELSPEQPTYTHDFELSRGVVAKGRVVGPDEQPVRGAELWLGWDQHAWDRLTTMSDDDGQFEFTHAPVGRTKLGANKAGFASSFELVELTALQGAQDIVVQLGRSRIVRGVVQDEAGAPLSGVSVSAHIQHDYVGQGGRTNARGEFEVTDLPAGAMMLQAYARGLVRVDVPLGEAEERKVITMHRAGRLRGKVIDAATRAPIRTFTVSFVWPSDPTLEPRVTGFDASWSDPGKTFDSVDGAWSTDEFDELLPGAWIGLSVTAAGYAPLLLPQVAVAGPEDDTVVVHALVGPVTAELAVVTRGTGAPVIGAAILARTTDAFDEAGARWSARTDDAGLAILTNVAPGPLFVRVTRADGLALKVGPFEVPSSGRRAVITVELPAGATVDVMLADEAGAPLAGRAVTLRAESVEGVRDAALSGVCGDDGRCRFTAVLPGVWKVARVERDGEHECLDVWRTLTLAPETDSVECELRVSGAATLRGSVRASEALPAGLVVSLLPRGLEAGRSAFVRDGRFEVRGLTPGAYVVTAGFWDRGTGETLMGHADLVVAAGDRELETVLELSAR